MKRRSAIPVAAFLLMSLQASGQSSARSGMATERPWASEHIEGLPVDIRRRIVALERVCGNAAAAAHYFAVSIEAGGRRFVSLHFEEFACGTGQPSATVTAVSMKSTRSRVAAIGSCLAGRLWM